MAHSFASLGLRPSLLETLTEEQLLTPTEIQEKAIPALLAGQSIVAVAETGSGKTLAFSLPLLHRLKALEDDGFTVTTPGQPRAAIIVPTRELGEQVARVLKGFTHTTRLRVRTVLVGVGTDAARRNVAGPFELLVATPGRLTQLLESKSLSLDAVRTLVLDEADQLLDMGFLPQVAAFVDACSPVRQLALFSATIPEPLEALIAEVFVEPTFIRSQGSHRVVATLTTINHRIEPEERFSVLEALLVDPLPGGAILFVNTREQCDTLAEQLRDRGWSCEVYRGELERSERRANLKRFRDGTSALLIATDLGARGLDIDHVGRVINYHMPHTVDSYLHRTGRTARAGRAGQVVNLVTARDKRLMQQLEHAKALPQEPKRK